MAGRASIENGKRGGRPKGTLSPHTLQALKAKEIFINHMMKEIEPIMTALSESAKGVVVGVTDPETGKITHVYKKPPNVKAIQEICDRFWGKATQPIDLGDDNPFKTLADIVNAHYDKVVASEQKKPAKSTTQPHAKPKKPTPKPKAKKTT